MSVVLAGIDEAGYGPTLGPLCVAMAAVRVRDWAIGQPAPNVWSLLSDATCTKPGDSRRRIPIADSKALKLSNDSRTRHPLTHLEHGVLAFLRAQDQAHIATDLDLIARLQCQPPPHEWYAGEGVTLPCGSTPDQIAISASRLAAAMEQAGVELLGIWVRCIGEEEFNGIIDRHGSKAEATAAGFGAHARRLVALWRELRASTTPSLSLRLVCDQLGGRTQYRGLLTRELTDLEVLELAEGDARSRYALVDTPRDATTPIDHHRAIVQFMPEAETHHLPVALASMSAKLVRELMMARFNRYWSARMPELKPTAGYATDARRWLGDVARVLRPGERSTLVRRA